MEYDLDDPLPFEGQFWGFWNRFSEEWLRLARVFGFLALLVALALPQSAKAQSAGYGIVCPTKSAATFSQTTHNPVSPQSTRKRHSRAHS
jgi:hypothetical protein